MGEAIQFERELVKISQVTGKSAKELTGLTQEITCLATGLVFLLLNYLKLLGF